MEIYGYGTAWTFCVVSDSFWLTNAQPLLPSWSSWLNCCSHTQGFVWFYTLIISSSTIKVWFGLHSVLFLIRLFINSDSFNSISLIEFNNQQLCVAWIYEAKRLWINIQFGKLRKYYIFFGFSLRPVVFKVESIFV